jgi:hypothetical protein
MTFFLNLIVTTGLVMAIGLGAVALCVAWSRLRVATRASARELEALAKRVERLESSFVEPSPTLPPSVRPDARPTPSLRSDPPSAPAPANVTLITVPYLARSDSTAESAANSSAELGARFAAIWESVDNGSSPAEIARATGEPIGQVELILNLRRHLETTANPPASSGRGGAGRP